MEGEVIVNKEEEVKEKRNIRSYGKWKPGKKTDSGKPLKKTGRPKGATSLNEGELKLGVGQVVNWMTFGKKEITDSRNIKAKVQSGQALTVEQACFELSITPQTFWNRLKQFPEVKELYTQLKADRREYLKELSETNVHKGLAGELGLSGKELMDASFKMLEKTDKAYQPKLEIEQKTVSINLHKSTDDIMGELALILGTNK